MRQESRRKSDDRMINISWRRNKSFPAQFGSEDETPDAERTLEFRTCINTKEVCEGLREDKTIREIL